MTRDNSSPSAAKKPALVLSPDGEIEGHVVPEQPPGHERSEKEIVYVPFEAAKTRWPLRSLLSHHTMHILLSNLAVALIVGLYFHFSSAPEAPPATLASTPPPVVTLRREPQPFDELKANAERIIQDQRWNIGLVNIFVDNWRALDESTRLSLTNSYWFEQFTAALVEKINLSEAPQPTAQEKATIYTGALLNMAALIGVEGLEKNPFSNPVATEPQTGAVDATLASGTDSDPQAASPGDTLNLNDNVNAYSNETQAHDRQAEAGAKGGDNTADITNIVAELSTKIAEAEANQTPDTTKGAQATKSAATDRPSARDASRKGLNGFTASDLHFLLAQYATTYEIGDTKKLLQLFHTSSDYRLALERSFNKVFAYSNKRQIEFTDLEWKFFQNSILGTGKYQATITLKNDKGTRFVNANIKVKITSNNHQLGISRLDFTDVITKVVPLQQKTELIPNTKATPDTAATAKTEPAASKQARNKHSRWAPKAPTAAELQDIITRFIGAYETGNLKAMDTIFAYNAKTNDRNNLSEIKIDYKNFFTNTDDRQLYIKNLHWSYSPTHATGVGHMNALVVPLASDKITTIDGEIQIIVARLEDKVLITHLYHNYQKN